VESENPLAFSQKTHFCPQTDSDHSNYFRSNSISPYLRSFSLHLRFSD